MKNITKDNLKRFAYTNEELLVNEPKGIVYEFHGLNDGISMNIPHTKLSYYFAEHSLIYIRPFYGPWNWMNRASVNMIDEITEVIYEKYNKELPIASSGLSMGGLSGLIYTRYAKYTPTVCAVICPVCDLVYHYDERDDTARTLYAAFGGYDIPLTEAIALNSPIHQTDRMPDAKYLILATLADDEVDYKQHSDPFVEKMKQLGRSVEYVKIPDRPHCDLDKPSVEIYKKFITDNI